MTYQVQRKYPRRFRHGDSKWIVIFESDSSQESRRVLSSYSSLEQVRLVVITKTVYAPKRPA